MKNLDVTWESGVFDPTGYLFSFAKSLGTAVKNSPYKAVAEDIIATSGFAFRMWVAKDLCPSATSIWSFDDQKRWVENSGLLCKYVGRYWNQDNIEEEKRLTALHNIRESIKAGIPCVSWDIGVPEWGLITGYDDQAELLEVLAVTGKKDVMPYKLLGKRELPLLSVLTITGIAPKTQGEILKDTLKLALSHLRGEEWCDNAKGLNAYPAFIEHFENLEPKLSWNMEYYLGTYGGLKYYAYKYFEKMSLSQLSGLYHDIYEAWQRAFNLIKSVPGNDTNDANLLKQKAEIASLLKTACERELQASEVMARLL